MRSPDNVLLLPIHPPLLVDVRRVHRVIERRRFTILQGIGNNLRAADQATQEYGIQNPTQSRKKTCLYQVNNLQRQANKSGLEEKSFGL